MAGLVTDDGAEGSQMGGEPAVATPEVLAVGAGRGHGSFAHARDLGTERASFQALTGEAGANAVRFAATTALTASVIDAKYGGQ